MNMRRTIAVGLLSLLSGCGGSSSTSPSSQAQPTFPDPPRVVSPPSGSVLTDFPRTTTLTWTTVTGATGYGLDIEYCLPPVCVDGTTVAYPTVTTTLTTYTFVFVGAQPGRWRVWSLGTGNAVGSKSDWSVFYYTR